MLVVLLILVLLSVMETLNLIRAGSSRKQILGRMLANPSRNLALQAISNDLAEVSATFENGKTTLDLLSEESSVEVTTTFKVNQDAVGQIPSTSGDDGVGYELQDESWNFWDS